ncbi:uncharacterized protein LOC128964335 [Oppia nitens]|uniref:uncharacterized protein LOC128964335 n=1 Tax=Oppia nitens TaxID=1686743 RepID=UPI0023DA2863|nr:uncharacterized protein LOC128964335 [Oppia nitens]
MFHQCLYMPSIKLKLLLYIVLLLTCLTKCDTNNNTDVVVDDDSDSVASDDEAAIPEEVVNFCEDNYIDSAYFNGYDIIVTRDDWLWYYYKDYHNLSSPFSQKQFTQGDHIQGAFNISKIPKCNVDDSVDCKEVLKMRDMAVYFLHNKARSRSYYNLDVRNRNGSQKRVKPKHLPWGMKQVGLLGGNLWPNGWEAYQEHRPVAYLPARYEMIFIMNGRNFSNTVLAWNSLDTKNWNSSWRYKDIGDQVVYTGMFEMNGIVYAIGETKNSIERVGKVYRYHMAGHNDRKLTETHQTVDDFFGCPEKPQKRQSIVNTIRTNREVRTGSILNGSSSSKSVTTDEDSILISIFIGIVITACLTTIVLAFLTITGRKKSKLSDSHIIESTVPKQMPVIGLDYSPRQTSNISRFDSMSSITAIYSQISRPPNKTSKKSIDYTVHENNQNNCY